MSSENILHIHPRPRAVWLRYATAFVSVVGILAAHMALSPYIGFRTPSVSLFVAVVFSSWFGGIGPGLFATALAAVLDWYYVVAPQNMDVEQWSAILLFLGQGSLVSYLVDALRRSRRHIEEMNEHLERRVNERTAQLNDTIKELEAFSYSISHDLRAPLRAIDGFSKLLVEDYYTKLDAEGRRLIDVIRNSTVRMGNLIDGLLAFAHLSRQTLASSEVNMRDLAEESYSEVHGSEPGRQVKIQIGDLPPVLGDRVLLRQVFVNLLSNALKFTRGKDPVVIEIGAAVTGDQNVFFVRDNGVGFDMRYADKLFGVFQRLHAVNEFEGTGLGLAIVHRIVNRHGGKVWAEGSLNEGATVSFSLPKMNSVSKAA